MSQELWSWSAADLAKAISERTISSREAVQSSLQRIAAVNPALNAVVEVLEKEALETADVDDAAVKSGFARGPLHGVPVTTKVNVDQRGCATTNGVVAFRDVIATEDSPAVANLRKAGASRMVGGANNNRGEALRYLAELPWNPDAILHNRSLGWAVLDAETIRVATGVGAERGDRKSVV